MLKEVIENNLTNEQRTGFVRILAATSWLSKGVATITHVPAVSIPRLPARPAICNKLEVSNKLIEPPPSLFASAQTTVVRAGMLIPAAKILLTMMDIVRDFPWRTTLVAIPLKT